MRNLTIYKQDICKHSNIDKYSKDDSGFNYFACLNPDNDDFYLLTQYGIHVTSSDKQNPTNILDFERFMDYRPIGMVSAYDRVFFAFECGNLVSVDIHDDSGVFEDAVFEDLQLNLHCMSMSPDQDVIVLVSTEGTVIIVDMNFQLISKVELFAMNFGEKQFVTVGWGKKETQFHGSEGKAAAKVKPTVITKSETDDEKPRITWRGDNTMFAVSFINKETRTRQFKVFNREGVLQYTSELLDGLEENISWKPSGNLITTTQKQPNKHVVALFEKNGLKHREFALPSNLKLKVKDLLWSSDSEILTIWSENLETGGTILQLWTEGNYHWYLKQTITFDKETPVIYVSWSSAPKSGKKLIILTKDNLIRYTFHWTINHSRGEDSTDKAVVGVIDGEKALLTGFKDGIVPPPMSQETLEVNDGVNAILFAPVGIEKQSLVNSNSVICNLDNYRLALYVDANESYLQYKFLKTFNIEWNNKDLLNKDVPLSLHHFLWFKENIVLCSASNHSNHTICVIRLNDLNSTDANHAFIEKEYKMDSAVEHVIPSPDTNSAYIVVNGTVLRYTDDKFVQTEVKLPEQCTKVEIVEIDKKHLIISLSQKHRLFIDGKEVSNNITSFYVHSDFLLLTTLQHTLICFPLNEKGIKQIASSDLTLKPWENGNNEMMLSELSIRRVERGSSLVLAIPKNAQTILQMPRGNLECIQPRGLSLYIIGSYLDNLNYRAAFDLMRKQRINLNLIYDHDPKSFIENASKFVNDIDNASWLSLFLSELKNEDVTQTTYVSSYQDENFQEKRSLKRQEIEMVPKVEKVCDILRTIMEEKEDSDRFMQPILISLVKKQQIVAFEDALKKVKQISSNESSPRKEENVSAEEALKYLLYLVDINVLFDTALGMYDFDLAMFVAQKSQKDPKEYIPFLNHLMKLEENYMKFSVDKHLKRYEKALEHIYKLEDKFSECLEHIKKHDLYMKALSLFDIKSNEYREIARAYGEFFMSKAKYREAGIMFHRSGCLKEALNAYKLAGSWQEVIIIVVQMKLSLIESYGVYEELVTRLKGDKKFKEAAEILMHYLQKSEDAVAVLCEGKAWQDAWKQTYCMKRLDLIETHVKPGVHEHAQNLILQIQKNKEEFCKYKSRLAFIRTDEYIKQVQLRNEIRFDNEPDTAKGFSDLLSETTSVAGSTISRISQTSRSSGRTYKSSKNRRKHERKLLNIKEGSIFEDLALLRALHQIIINSYAQNDEVTLVSQMLLNFHNDKLAEELHNVYSSFLRLIEYGKSEIWIKKDTEEKLGMKNVENFENPQNQLPTNLVEPCILYPPETKSNSLGLDIFAPMKADLTT